MAYPQRIAPAFLLALARLMDRARMTNLVRLLAATFLLAPNANATTILWSGSGISGVDPFGHHWDIAIGNPGESFWAMPPIGFGDPPIPFRADEAFTDFHIRFDLPPGVTIDTTPGFFSTAFAVEPFNVAPGSAEWNAVYDPDLRGVTFSTFLAPGPHHLVLFPSRQFIVRVKFAGDIPYDDRFSFQATWTQDGLASAAAVPEPGTIVLLSLGLAGLAVKSRKREA